MVEIRPLGKLDTKPLEEEFGRLGTDEVVVTAERFEHIRKNHPQDIELFEKFGEAAIQSPDIILKDQLNENTVFIIKKLEDTNINVVIRLILETDEQEHKNSVMTFYRIRTKNLVKLEKKHKTLYKKE